jgi:hypothetical protein
MQNAKHLGRILSTHALYQESSFGVVEGHAVLDDISNTLRTLHVGDSYKAFTDHLLSNTLPLEVKTRSILKGKS